MSVGRIFVNSSVWPIVMLEQMLPPIVTDSWRIQNVSGVITQKHTSIHHQMRHRNAMEIRQCEMNDYYYYYHDKNTMRAICKRSERKNNHAHTSAAVVRSYVRPYTVNYAVRKFHVLCGKYSLPIQ